MDTRASAPVPASVVIVAYNGAAHLPACLGALARNDRSLFELVVVDNASTDGSAELAERLWPGVRLIRNPSNLGFGSGNNVGIRAARGDVLLLLNQDTEVPADWVATMLAAMAAAPTAGAVGCKLLYPDCATIQHAGGILYPNALTAHLGMGERDDGRWNEAGTRTYVTAAAMALRRAALEQIGLFDPGFDPAYFEEVDLQLRLWRAGWQVRYEPRVAVLHHESSVLGSGRPATVMLYTRHRVRLLALHGRQGGAGECLRAELRWLADMRRTGRLMAALRGWCAGLLRWPLWRAQRKHRRIPRLEPIA